MGRSYPSVAAGRDLLRTHETKVRFLGAGLLNTVFGLGIYPLLMWVSAPLGHHYLVALVISYGLSVSFAYATNKRLVFKTEGNHLREFLRFLVPHAFYLMINLLVLPVLVEAAHLKPIVAQLSFSVFIVVTSYLWHSRVTFSPSQAGSTRSPLTRQRWPAMNSEA